MCIYFLQFYFRGWGGCGVEGKEGTCDLIVVVHDLCLFFILLIVVLM